MTTLRRILGWLYAHLHPSHAPEPTLTLPQALAETHPQPHRAARFDGPPRFFRRHVIQGNGTTRRSRKARARIVALARRKGVS